MQLIKKYTEEHYAAIQEIKNDFNVIGSHVILDEIERYRERYKIQFIYQNQKISLVLIPKIVELMNAYYPFQQQDVLHPMIQLFILRNQPSECLACMKTYHLSESYFMTFDYVYSFEEDITKSFLEWLEHLSQFSFVKMIHYEHVMKQLTTKQQQFYVRYAHHYFDIEAYQHWMNISYETARLHLAKMCEWHVLECHKIGKKYVYKGEL